MITLKAILFSSPASCHYRIVQATATARCIRMYFCTMPKKLIMLMQFCIVLTYHLQLAVHVPVALNHLNEHIYLKRELMYMAGVCGLGSK